MAIQNHNLTHPHPFPHKHSRLGFLHPDIVLLAQHDNDFSWFLRYLMTLGFIEKDHTCSMQKQKLLKKNKNLGS